MAHTPFLQRFLPLACGAGLQITVVLEQDTLAPMINTLMPWIAQVRCGR